MKRIITAVLVFVISLTLAFNAMAAWYGYGDVTGDKKVNSADALAVLQYSTGIKSLSADQKRAADVDGNNKINSSDALLILKYSVKNIDCFPIEQGSDPDIDHEIFE